MEGRKEESTSTVALVAYAVDPSSVSTCLQDSPLGACMVPGRLRTPPSAGGCSQGRVDDGEKTSAENCYVIEPATLSDNTEDDEDFTYGSDLEIELRAALFSASGESSAPPSDNGVKTACFTAPAEDEKVNELDDYDQLIRDATRLRKEQVIVDVSTGLLARADAGEILSKGVPRVVQTHETQEDFIRSFLIDEKMHKTLLCFQTEWYELRLKKAGMSSNDVANRESAQIPSALLVNQQLKGRITSLEQEVMKQRETATKALCWFDHFKKERDFHRMHHRRLKHDNDKNIQALKQLNTTLEQMSAERESLQQKVRAGIQECTLIKMERDKLATQVKLLRQQSLQRPFSPVETESVTNCMKVPLNNAPATPQEDEIWKKTTQHPNFGKGLAGDYKTRDSTWRTHRRMHLFPKQVQCEGEGKIYVAQAKPYIKVEEGQGVRTSWAANADSVTCFNVVEAHDAAVVSLATHSKVELMATTSDDGTWKIWQIPHGQLIMAGSGHEDWVSSAAFHPVALVLVTASGDSTAKLWSISRETCAHTFTDHTKPLWDCCFHASGDFFATCSMDHTIRCFDANSLRCRQILRAHMDSVNAICFQPYTNCIASVSSDKMVNFWDLRTGTPVRKFAGHRHSCNGVSFSHQVILSFLRKTGPPQKFALLALLPPTATAVAAAAESARVKDTIISCDSGGVLHVWDLRKMSNLLERNCGPAAANSCVADIKGESIAVSSSESTIKLLNIKQAGVITNLEGHTDYVLDVQFSKDYRYLCSAGADGKVRLWQ